MPSNNTPYNFFDSYYMAGMIEEIVPVTSFFRDRYFPTDASDIFAADKVLVEYQDGDRKMAPFVSPRTGDIPIARGGYEIHEFQPARIAPSRSLTVDDLRKRGFGEAVYANTEPADRARILQLRDLTDLDRRIARREEWMAADTMKNNGCSMISYIDDNTVGETFDVFFYNTNGSNPALYAVAEKWDASGSTFQKLTGDVRAMCRLLTSRGLPATDLVLGVDAADALLQLEDVQKLLDKNSGIATGAISLELSRYDGVVFMGTLNFGGYKLNLISVDETYVDETGTKSYFPSTSAMVTAPGCGHMMYGQITQIEENDEFETFAMQRVPKLIVDREHDIRKLRVAARPLAAPRNKAPWIHAPNVVGQERSTS